MTAWGRWGADDERGALNLVGPAEVLRGIAAVREGLVLSLAAPIGHNRGYGLADRVPPTHYMVRSGADYAAGLPERAGFGFADDVISLPTHGATHVDALGHIWRNGLMYNGFPASQVSGRGARRLGIEKMPPLVTRGVFVDTCPGGMRSVAEPVHAEELAELVESAGVPLSPGDALLVRTGWLQAAIAGDASGETWPGLDRDCADYLADHDVVLVGADNPAVECFPSSDPDCQMPLHVALIRDRGVYLAELLDLAELAGRGRSEFLFAVAPLPVEGAVGSPVAPMAVL